MGQDRLARCGAIYAGIVSRHAGWFRGRGGGLPVNILTDLCVQACTSYPSRCSLSRLRRECIDGS